MVSFGRSGRRCTPLRGPDAALRFCGCYPVFCSVSHSPPPSGTDRLKKSGSAGGNVSDLCTFLRWTGRLDCLSLQPVELRAGTRSLAGGDHLLEFLSHYGGPNVPTPVPPGGAAPTADPFSRWHRLPLSQLLECLSFPGECRDVPAYRLFHRPALAAWESVALHTGWLSGLSEHRDHSTVHRPGHGSG